MYFNNFLFKTLPEIVAYAHCDIPCGIYEPTPAKIAAVTVRRMVEQIKAMEKLKESDTETLLYYHNDIARRIAVKEEHAQLCKKELLILWTDFFKPEHLEKFPGLHEKFWKAAKLCSKNKQDVNAELAQQLVDAVDEIAKIFYEVKGVPERFEAYKTLTDKLY
jgi:nickel superoxide dismutase